MLIINGIPQEEKAPDHRRGKVIRAWVTEPEKAIAPPAERAIKPEPERAVKPPAERRTRKPRNKKKVKDEAPTDSTTGD